jgi:flagellar basal-body rod modification protein FlgD
MCKEETMAAISTNLPHGAVPLANASDTNSTASDNTNSATISSNDFLTLLVTEMQNQDPTAATDPNEYINQLVNVNSLEQLISINQTLTTATSVTGGVSHAGNSPAVSQPKSESLTSLHPPASPIAVKSAASAMSAVASAQTLAARTVPGNLGIPKTNPAAESVARALTRH